MSLPEVLFDGHRVLLEVRADYPTFRANDVAIVLDAAWRARYPTLAGIESPEVQEKTAARVALRLLTEQ